MASAITYRAFGRVAGWTWGNSQTHGFTFDTENRLLTYPRGASAIELGYDPNSNVSSRTDQSAPSQAESFNYDALDRLTGQMDSATSRGWAYDAVGNRTSSTVGATTTSYTYSATSNRLTQIGTTPPATIVTDANGAVTDDGVNQYTYDARGRLTGATTAAGSITYLVGPRGRRLAKTTSAGTTYYIYDQAGHLIAELDSTGAPVQEHIWLNDTPLAMAQGTTLYYVDTDQLNTPRALINATGTVVWRWTGEAFGDSPAEEDPDADATYIAYNLRFAGQYYDRETNTFYNGARDYDPAIGRYLQSDPIGLAGGINTYAYVNGNPLGFVDPYGLWRLGEPLPQGLANGFTGFGDGVYRSITLGLLGDLQDFRDFAGIDGGIDKCSAAYNDFKYVGYAWGAATLWAGGLNGGSNSVFWSGAGNMEQAMKLGTSLESTPIGSIMNSAGKNTPYWLWKLASATYAANAKSTAIKVGAEAGSIWRTIEQPILNWRDIPVKYVR